MKKTLMALAIVTMCTSAFATHDGDDKRTGCNGYGTPNNLCQPSSNANANANASAAANAAAIASNSTKVDTKVDVKTTNTNTNNNANLQGQQQGQIQGQKQSINDSGNSSNVNVNSVNTKGTVGNVSSDVKNSGNSTNNIGISTKGTVGNVSSGSFSQGGSVKNSGNSSIAEGAVQNSNNVTGGSIATGAVQNTNNNTATGGSIASGAVSVSIVQPDTSSATKDLADSAVQAALIQGASAKEVAEIQAAALRDAANSKIRNTPSVNGPALTSSNDTCMGSTSGSLNLPGIGIGGGSSWVDTNCKMLKNSRELWNMGFKAAAIALMCTDPDNRAALEDTGFECPQTTKKKANNVSQNAEYTDPIVRARLGLAPLSN